MQMTLEQFMPPTSRQPTAGASDSLARISALPENRSAFTATVQACFSELCTLLDKPRKQRNPLTCSLRTLRICLVLMEDGISPDFSLKWTGGGYDAEWQVLNSTDFGVPQNRERVFIVGYLRGRSAAKVFPLEGADGEDCIQINQIGRLPNANRENSGAYRVYDPDGLAPTLTNMSGGGREPMIGIKIIGNTRLYDGKAKNDKERIFAIDGIGGGL